MITLDCRAHPHLMAINVADQSPVRQLLASKNPIPISIKKNLCLQHAEVQISINMLELAVIKLNETLMMILLELDGFHFGQVVV